MNTKYEVGEFKSIITYVDSEVDYIRSLIGYGFREEAALELTNFIRTMEENEGKYHRAIMWRNWKIGFKAIRDNIREFRRDLKCNEVEI